jgi:hypothetical protein
LGRFGDAFITPFAPDENAAPAAIAAAYLRKLRLVIVSVIGKPILQISDAKCHAFFGLSKILKDSNFSRDFEPDEHFPARGQKYVVTTIDILSIYLIG